MKKHRHGPNRLVYNANPLKVDPTRTTALRNSLIRQMQKRLLQLRRAIKHIVVDLDVFGLIRQNPFAANERFFFESYGIKTPRPSEIESILGIGYNPNVVADVGGIVAAQTASAQLTAYRSWLLQQVEAGILQVPSEFAGKPWLSPYIESSYKQAAVRTWADIHGAAGAASAMGVSQSAFLQSAFARPFAQNQMQLLATRAFQQLQGVTAAMEQQMSRILADGLAHGRHPRAIARELNKVVSGLGRNRANTIARTEIIHSYAEGTLDTFELAGMEEVTIMAEWLTAGDDRVCDICASLEGKVYKVEEARGMLPRHPNCRCAWIPYDPMFDKHGKPGGTTRKQEIQPEASTPRDVQLEKQRQLVMEKGKKDQAEHMVLMDKDGKVIAKNSGDPLGGSVDIPNHPALADKQADLIAIHNHPDNTRLSPQDFKMFDTHRGIKQIDAITHEGVTNSASIIGDPRDVSKFIDKRMAEINGEIADEVIKLGGNITNAQREALLRKKHRLLEEIADELEKKGLVKLQAIKPKPKPKPKPKSKLKVPSRMTNQVEVRKRLNRLQAERNLMKSKGMNVDKISAEIETLQNTLDRLIKKRRSKNRLGFKI